MKRISRIFVTVFTVILLAVCALSFTACEDIKKLEVNVSVYDASQGRVVDKTLKIDLYRHLANDTVDAIMNYVKNGYYNDTIFYIDNGESRNGAVSLGDFKLTSDFSLAQVRADYVKTVRGQFTYGGTVGSDLKVEEGSLCLWRHWNTEGFTVNKAMNTGMATMFMPTGANTSFDGYFCVFGKFDIENADNKETWELLKSVFTDVDSYVEYTVYYTGTFDENSSDKYNYGLTYNACTTEEFDKKGLKPKDDYFVAEKGEYVAFNMHTVSVPVRTINSTKVVSAKINSIAVK